MLKKHQPRFDSLPFSSCREEAPVKSLLLLASVALAIGFFSAGVYAADAEPALESGYIALFNGKDLTGWREDGKADNVDGKIATADGRFSIADGILVVNEGKGYGVLTTTREFNGNFHLKLEFRAAARADSGVFIRGIQLQCRDYPRVGPYKSAIFKDADWNELDITVTNNVLTTSLNGQPLAAADDLQFNIKDGQPIARLNSQPVLLSSLQVNVGPVALCRCNGGVIEAAFKVGASGGIGLQNETGKFEYRRLRLKELPDTGKP